jgi:hypothetical protein
MITQSEYLRELAQHTHFALGDLMSRANRMREAGILMRGGRGLSAAKIEPDEAALILLAAMSGASANTCPEAARKLSMLEAVKIKDFSKLPPETVIQCEENGEATGTKLLKDVPEAELKQEEIFSLGGQITMILDDPLKADQVKSFMVDFINNYAVLILADGQEIVFGKKDIEANSGSIIMLHGRVFRLLSCSILPEDERHRDPAYFKWVSRVVKIGNEQGDEAAQAWIKENPFKPVNE